MKSLDELDHYEVLEVPPGAGSEDIERAYQMTRAAYTEGSMALYSIYDSDDALVIRNRIDEAYRVLADPDNRGRYDAEAGIARDPSAAASAQGAANGLAGARGGGPGRRSSVVGGVSLTIEALDDLDAEIDEESQEFDGAALRRARLRRGVDLDQISDLTKVSVRFLACLEEEEFDKLPAPVYVRGFVHAYARSIGLDAERVAADYMLRVQAASAST